MGEHCLAKAGVTGSIPVISTKSLIIIYALIINWGVFPDCSLTIEYGSGNQFSNAENCFFKHGLFFVEHKRDLLKICFDQAIKGKRWMPWHREATKDVVSCDKLRGGANNL
jgi:hypothetical protein